MDNYSINKFLSGNRIRKMQTAAGGGLVYDDGKNIERTNYNNWSKLSFVDKMKRRFNIAKHLFNESSSPIINSVGAIFGEYDPENPDLNTGIVNAPGRATPQLILLSAKLMETINNYWKNLGRLKVRLSGGRATSGILTKPGTAPTTFNGLNINYITSPKGGNVTHKFYTDLGSEYILTKDGFARRVKSPHNNTLGQGSGPTEWNATNSDAGLHNWNEGTTIFTEGEDGKLFNTAFYKLSDFGFKPGTYGLARKGEKARIMLIDPKTKLWRAAMLSDVYPTTVKLGLQADRVMETNYSDVPKLGWHILEKTNGGWHPGSPVAFIEGLKQGGKMNILEFLKNGSDIHIKEKNKGKFTSYCGGKVTDECIRKAKASGNPTLVKRATFAANARKWKHKDGGILYIFLEGGKTKNSFWKNAGNFLVNSGLGNALIEGGLGLLLSSSQNKSIAGSADIAKSEIDMEEQEAKQLAMLKAKQDALNMLLLDPNNPNAFGGNIFLNYILLLLYNENLDYIKKNSNNRKKLIDVLSLQMQGENTSNAFSNILGLGANALMNYLGNKASNKTTATNNSGGGWTMNYNSLYGNKNNYNTFFLTGSLPKMNSVAAPNTSWLNNNPLLA